MDTRRSPPAAGARENKRAKPPVTEEKPVVQLRARVRGMAVQLRPPLVLLYARAEGEPARYSAMGAVGCAEAARRARERSSSEGGRAGRGAGAAAVKWHSSSAVERRRGCGMVGNAGGWRGAPGRKKHTCAGHTVTVG